MLRRVGVFVGVLIALALTPADVWAQVEGPLVTARYNPALRFRTIATGNFEIYFHQREEALAQRLVRLVQEIAPALDARLGAPRGRVRIVLVDQTDVSNGWASIIPYNLIELAAVPPAGASEIGNTDDWLRLVFTHEYTHILHLEQSRGWLGSLRHVFGRVPLFYSNLFLPAWQIEGLATFEESAVAGHGRVNAGDFRMILDHAAAANRFAPLDRATTAVIDWPGGTSAYLYGAFFHDYLARRYGEASFARLASETAGRLPFFGSRAFKKIYGKSLGTLWDEFAAETQAAAHATRQPRQRLTRHGFSVTAPAFAADGRLFYSIANPHGFPALMELVNGEPREVTTRYHGNRLAAAGDLLVFDQLEVAGQVGLRSDLFVYDVRTEDTRRLTFGARAGDPDITPDGQAIVCTIQRTGRRELAVMRATTAGAFGDPVALVSEEGTEYSSARWSPDAKSIVAERRRLGGPSELVLIDVAQGSVKPLFSAPRGRVVMPTWTPDGSKVLFSWDRDRSPVTLYSVAPHGGPVQQLLEAGDGAQAPAISPDGRRVVFVGYSADGYDLFSLDLASATWQEVIVSPATQTAAPAAAAPADTIPSRPYSPVGTLAPRAWSPYVERDGDDTVVGATTIGFDALGRHTYFVAAGWGIPRNRGDIQAEYTYARWWPALFAGIADDTDARRDGFIRSRDLAAGVLLPFRRVRWSSDVLASASYSTDDLIDANEDVTATRERTATRIGIRLSNAKAFGYSISGERGATVSVVSEFARGDSGETARSFVADVRGYLPVMPRHGVFAARAAYATSRGSVRVRREFSAGGSGPQAAGFGVGVDAVGLLRGFDAADLFGRSAVVFNADYRIPFGWPQRGYGTLPFFLRAVHGAVFVDGAHAWDADFRREQIRRSVGAELSFDVVLGGALPTTFATGFAWREDPTGSHDGAAVFFRVGRAF